MVSSLLNLINYIEPEGKVCWLYIVFRNTASSFPLQGITLLIKRGRKWEKQNDKQVKCFLISNRVTLLSVASFEQWALSLFFKGRAHSEDAAEGGQEDCASSGVEENSSDPQSHSWTSAAVPG